MEVEGHVTTNERRTHFQRLEVIVAHDWQLLLGATAGQLSGQARQTARDALKTVVFRIDTAQPFLGGLVYRRHSPTIGQHSFEDYNLPAHGRVDRFFARSGHVYHGAHRRRRGFHYEINFLTTRKKRNSGRGSISFLTNPG